jgi:hypothetical protein
MLHYVNSALFYGGRVENQLELIGPGGEVAVCDLIGAEAYDRLTAQGKEREQILEALRLSTKKADNQKPQ